jgi:hypothetical protein
LEISASNQLSNYLKSKFYALSEPKNEALLFYGRKKAGVF